jgi:valyl-tRNA synthetase
MNVDRAKEAGISVDLKILGQMPETKVDTPLEAGWIISEFLIATFAVNQSLTNYRYDDAASTIYQFFWGSFCDWYLEIVKLRLDFTEDADKAATTAALTTLMQVFEGSLRLLSPFMPFLTEEIWHAIYENKTPAKSIALTRYPTTGAGAIEPIWESMMSLLQELIVEVRALRKEIGVEEKVSVPIEVRIDAAFRPTIEQNKLIIERLARVESITFPEAITLGVASHATASFDVGVIYHREIDIPAERERLAKEVAKFEKAITNSERQLTNQAFLEKAPANIVEGLKKQEAENRQLLEKAKAALAALPPE